MKLADIVADELDQILRQKDLTDPEFSLRVNELRVDIRSQIAEVVERSPFYIRWLVKVNIPDAFVHSVAKELVRPVVLKKVEQRLREERNKKA